ncbi:exodeoxyribonuclease III [Candidatus Microgenomates bacterium]|nr:exodeoxyribonuclease III [Candidatus Microgenomates bacterium]
MKIICWNVNGINSSVKTGLLDFIKSEKADIYCFQETKVTPEKVGMFLSNIEGYESFWSFSSVKKGYSGVVTYTKKKPQSVFDSIGWSDADLEGRTIVTEFEDFYLLNCYFPNANDELSRLPFRMKYNDHLLKFCEKLREKKPIIICGDFNVAHEEIDLTNFKANRGKKGFTDEERGWFTKLLEHGYVDTFRLFEKDGGHYTWWSHFGNARANNVGWRIDYFVVSSELKDKVKKSYIRPEVIGSDHCPIVLELEK